MLFLSHAHPRACTHTHTHTRARTRTWHARGCAGEALGGCVVRCTTRGCCALNVDAVRRVHGMRRWHAGRPHTGHALVDHVLGELALDRARHPPLLARLVDFPPGQRAACDVASAPPRALDRFPACRAEQAGRQFILAGAKRGGGMLRCVVATRGAHEAAAAARAKRSQVCSSAP